MRVSSDLGWGDFCGGRSSVGRAQGCGPCGRGFESRRPPHLKFLFQPQKWRKRSFPQATTDHFRSGLLVALCFALLGTELSGQRQNALDKYVARPDSSYVWRVTDTISSSDSTIYVVDLTSQRWRMASEIDQPVWKHWLTIVKPNKVIGDKAMLYIAGGSNRGTAPKQANPVLVGMATRTHSVVAELRMVPNQPLRFSGSDDRLHFEDDLIAHAWKRFFVSGDEIWLPRFPMVKSVVRAMDTIQTLMAGEVGGQLQVNHFVVSGASKRGWVAWLTGGVDKRVAAVIPIAIDILNARESIKHHYRAYGFWAPALKDYTRHGIMDWIDTPEFEELLRLVDPYRYRDRLTMPKYIVNASGDEFFLPDSWRFYFYDLLGEKYLRYVPNATHSLRRTDLFAGIESYYRAILEGRARPCFSWKVETDGSIYVKTESQPLEVNLWKATNPESRDFRVATIGHAYARSILQTRGEGQYIARVQSPGRGWTAFFIELIYDSGTKFPLKFTTGVQVVPDMLPFNLTSKKDVK